MEQRRDIENTKPACRLITGECVSAPQGAFGADWAEPEIHPSTLEENPICTEPAQVCDGTGGTEGRAM